MGRPIAGCLGTMLALALCAGVPIMLLKGCLEQADEARRAEEARRAALSPEERAAEDQATADVEAAQTVQRRDERLQEDAREAAERYVRGILKHPDDASFGWFTVPQITTNDARDLFTVSSTVKAKNDFGAELTHRYRVLLRLRNDTFDLLSCEIDGEAVYENEAAVGQILDENLAKAKAAQRQAVDDAKAAREAAKEFRTWTSAGGGYSIEAQFDGMASGTVTLVKRDGEHVKVPLDKLSKADQDWIAERKKQ